MCEAFSICISETFKIKPSILPETSTVDGKTVPATDTGWMAVEALNRTKWLLREITALLFHRANQCDAPIHG
jgi:hypothetical protein